MRPLAFNGSGLNSSTDEEAAWGDVCTIADVSYSNDTPDGLTRLEVVVRGLNVLVCNGKGSRNGSVLSPVLSRRAWPGAQAVYTGLCNAPQFLLLY